MKKVHLFVPCYVDQLFPEVAIHSYQLLEKLGCQVFYNPEQTCCGQPAFNAGFVQEASEVYKKFWFDFKEADYIVSPSSSCVGFVNNYGPQIADFFGNRKIYELTQFIQEVLKVEQIPAKFKAKLAYHSSCASLRECHNTSITEHYLKQIEGIELVSFKDAENCCGFGGSFAVKFTDISTSLGYDKLNKIALANPTHITSNDMSCLMHLQGCQEKLALPIKIIHIAEIFNSF
ncbi:MAG: (Fe-S)-binding protein [Sediminibacterium sp.]|nr:(Fe-S)-binding protein [Sediminibacterium sp.]